jgi:hypothetical protein
MHMLRVKRKFKTKLRFRRRAIPMIMTMLDINVKGLKTRNINIVTIMMMSQWQPLFLL